MHITNVTAGFGAMNLAGPRSRDILRKLTDCDLDANAFPYMACREAAVNGIPAHPAAHRICRRNRLGDPLPGRIGGRVVETILDAGQEFGIRPFGVEAQRLLRLEKRHVIVGVDTDALTSPYEADMGWAVKLDKSDFVGKASSDACTGDARIKRGNIWSVLLCRRPACRMTAPPLWWTAGRPVASPAPAIRLQAAGIGLAWVKPRKHGKEQSIDIRVGSDWSKPRSR